tara:strand:- start:24305 stop:24757 length:453 start_codon:yes stop_codon:yes gene_type:complete
MAIIDTEKTKKPYVIDRDTNSFVGLDLPLHRGGGAEGNFKCTETVRDAVIVNIKNLLQTELKERVFQPNIGIQLRQYLFEPFTEEIKTTIQESIIKTFNFWLPFVLVKDVMVNMAKSDDDVNKNTLRVKVTFALNSTPSVLESVQVQYGA